MTIPSIGQLFTTCLGGMATLGIVGSIAALRTSFIERGLRSDHDAMMATVGPAAPRAQPVSAVERTRAIAAGRSRAETLGAPWFFSQAAEAQVVAMLRTAAEAERNEPQRIALFCAALSRLGGMMAEAPRDARVAINWANLRQLLGSTSCSEPLTKGDYRVVLRHALAAEPRNMGVAYAAGLILGWAGERAEMLALFREVITLRLGLSPAQVETMVAEIKTAGDAAAVIPARFPQILTWSKLLRDRAPGSYSRFFPGLESLQQVAVEESEREASRGNIPAEMHQERLFELLPFAAGTTVRRLIDRRIVQDHATPGYEQLQAFFKARAGLDDLQVVRASAANDTRPAASALVDWNRDGPTYFDESRQTMGFYVPRGQMARMIELRNQNSANEVSPALVRVLGSVDNLSWIELGNEVQIEAFRVGPRGTVGIWLPESPYRFWKIHFASGERNHTFGNSLSQLVTVYGYARSEHE